MMADPTADVSAESSNGDDSQNQDQSAQSGNDNSFFIPADVAEAAGYKEGDKEISLKVIGPDADGDIEVCGQCSEGSDWRSDLTNSLKEAGKGQE